MTKSHPHQFNPALLPPSGPPSPLTKLDQLQLEDTVLPPIDHRELQAKAGVKDTHSVIEIPRSYASDTPTPPEVTAAWVTVPFLLIGILLFSGWASWKREQKKNTQLQQEHQERQRKAEEDCLNRKIHHACFRFNCHSGTNGTPKPTTVREAIYQLPELVWDYSIEAEDAALLEKHADKLILARGNLRPKLEEANRTAYLDGKLCPSKDQSYQS